MILRPGQVYGFYLPQLAIYKVFINNLHRLFDAFIIFALGAYVSWPPTAQALTITIKGRQVVKIVGTYVINNNT